MSDELTFVLGVFCFRRPVLPARTRSLDDCSERQRLSELCRYRYPQRTPCETCRAFVFSFATCFANAAGFRSLMQKRGEERKRKGLCEVQACWDQHARRPCLVGPNCKSFRCLSVLISGCYAYSWDTQPHSGSWILSGFSVFT